MNDIAVMVNDLEQYSRRECLEIRGIPVLGNRPHEENTDNIVIKVAELIGVKINHEDISVSHRFQTNKLYQGKNKEAPPIHEA